MTRSATPKLVAYAGLAAVGLLAALAARLPELVVVAGPFAVVVAVGLLLARRPHVEAVVTVDRERVLEGDDVVVDVRLEAVVGAEHLRGEVTGRIEALGLLLEMNALQLERIDALDSFVVGFAGDPAEGARCLASGQELPRIGPGNACDQRYGSRQIGDVGGHREQRKGAVFGDRGS